MDSTAVLTPENSSGLLNIYFGVLLLSYLLSAIWITRNKDRLYIIKRKRWIFNLIIPSLISITFGGLLYFAIQDISILQQNNIDLIVSAIFTVGIAYLTYHMQRYFVIFVIPNNFFQFLNSVSNKDIVTIEFFRRILEKCIDTENFFKVLSDYKIGNFKALTDGMELSGIELSDALYSELLNCAMAANPTKHYAIWNENFVKTDNIQEVTYYCNSYSIFYKHSDLEEKHRIFVSNSRDIPNFDAIKDYHFTKWKFKKVYFLHTDQFEDMMKKYLAMSSTDYVDFVLLESKNQGWLIGKTKTGRIVFRKNDQFDEALKFYNDVREIAEPITAS